LELKRSLETALEKEFIAKTLDLKPENKGSKWHRVTFREIKDARWECVLEKLAILGQQGEINHEPVHGINVD
tara:strand:- start:442 stop:657 length:216 start_codon:yes stop_codon:yes gene_type:complete